MENTEDVEVAIDPATGLPALDEGFQWRVEMINDRIYVSLEQIFVETAIDLSVEKVRGPWWKLFLPQSKAVEAERTVKSAVPTITKPLREMVYLTPTKDREGWSCERGISYENYLDLGWEIMDSDYRGGIHMKKDLEPTKESIRLVAERIILQRLKNQKDILRREEEERERQKALDEVRSLVGVYPPKTLVEGN